MKPNFAENYARLNATLTDDTVLLMRMGDFYEAYGTTAECVSSICGLTMTRRAGIPMCGLPYHSLDYYADKLISAGYAVAVSEAADGHERRIDNFITGYTL